MSSAIYPDPPRLVTAVCGHGEQQRLSNARLRLTFYNGPVAYCGPARPGSAFQQSAVSGLLPRARARVGRFRYRRPRLQWPLTLAVIAALALCAGWGAIVERIAVRPFVQRGSNAWLMATVALGIVLENVVLFTFGKDPRGMPAGLLTTNSVVVAGIRIQLLQLLIPILGLLLAAAIQIFFRRFHYGKALLAVVQNKDAARLMGIDVERVVMASFALSGLLAGIAGIMVAPLFTISSTMGTLFGIKAFAVAILGGIGNSWRVVLAGLSHGAAP